MSFFAFYKVILKFSENTGNILGASEWNTGYPSTATVYPSYAPMQPPYYKPDAAIHIPSGKISYLTLSKINLLHFDFTLIKVFG